jgi:hypothetical protein
MTDAISAMEYLHWLIAAGTILVVIGFGFRQKQGHRGEF